MKSTFRTLVLSAVILSSPLAFANREGGGRVSASAVYVDFKSFGSGIDSDSLAVTDSLTELGVNDGTILEAKMDQKGREGERQICLLMSDAGARLKLISSLAPYILKDRKIEGVTRTDVYVGTDCNDISRATLQDITKY
jgi:hypothetical protein